MGQLEEKGYEELAARMNGGGKDRQHDSADGPRHSRAWNRLKNGLMTPPDKRGDDWEAWSDHFPDGRVARSWTMLPRIYEWLDLKQGERLLLVSLLVRMDFEFPGMGIEAGTVELQNATGMKTAKTLRAHITGLEQKGYLRRIPGSGKDDSVYFLLHEDLIRDAQVNFNEWSDKQKTRRFLDSAEEVS